MKTRKRQLYDRYVQVKADLGGAAPMCVRWTTCAVSLRKEHNGGRWTRRIRENGIRVSRASATTEAQSVSVGIIRSVVGSWVMFRD